VALFDPHAAAFGSDARAEMREGQPSGHAAATPPSSVMNPRRLNGSNGIRRPRSRKDQAQVIRLAWISHPILKAVFHDPSTTVLAQRMP
jgi:hypothetical protein